MLIDCNTCVARHVACRDCIVTVLLAQPALQFDLDPDTAVRPAVQTHVQPLDLDQDERDAIDTLAGAGLVPPLRLVRRMPDLSEKIRDSA